MALLALIMSGGCSDRSRVDPQVVAAGGATTVARADPQAFSQPAANTGFAERGRFEAGNHLFRTPRSPDKGTGPLLNVATCQGCHVLDGRGGAAHRSVQANGESELPDGMLVRLGIPAQDGREASLADPVYGNQFQHRSAFDLAQVPVEGLVSVTHERISGAYPDGKSFDLLRPVLRIHGLGYGPFAGGIQWSPRVAPPVFGSGLLEAIAASDIEALADPDDTNGDGISGRPNRVLDPTNDRPRIGRFGLKAGAASVLDQVVAAYRNDMGLTSRFAPVETCTPAQAGCLEAAARTSRSLARRSQSFDLTDSDLASMEQYVRLLAVPARRGWDPATGRWQPEVMRGEQLFKEIGCASCHHPHHVTGTLPESVLANADALNLARKHAGDVAALSNQQIRPYTDLLLHDMGGRCEVTPVQPGSSGSCGPDSSCEWVQRCSGLADGYHEGLANGREWRTPPLWGVGLAQVVNPSAGFLHDGRARTLEEAILWHGQSPESEAAAVYRRFIHLADQERAALLAFVESL